MNILLGKPLRAAKVAMLEATTMRMKKDKLCPYLSLRGGDECGGLRLRRAGLLWRLRDPSPTSTAGVAKAGTTTGGRATAAARATTGAGTTARAGAIANTGAAAGGRPSTITGASHVPVACIIMHPHSSSDGGAGGSDTIPTNGWFTGRG